MLTTDPVDLQTLCTVCIWISPRVNISRDIGGSLEYFHNTREYNFWTRKVCEGGNQVNAYACRYNCGSLSFSPKFMITWLQTSLKCDFDPPSISSNMHFWSIFYWSNGPKVIWGIGGRSKIGFSRSLKSRDDKYQKKSKWTKIATAFICLHILFWTKNYTVVCMHWEQ